MSEIDTQSGILATRDIRAFFREEILDVLERRGVELEEHTEFYLVNLLARFSDAEQLYDVDEAGRRDDTPLAFLLKRALEAPPAVRAELFRQLGDRSLYRAGFFSDSLARSLVDIDYYIAMGGRAYSSAADLSRSGPRTVRTFAAVFAELAQKFRRVVDVLMELSERVRTTGTDDVARLYERWLHLESDRLAEQLARAGLVPAAAPKGTVH